MVSLEPVRQVSMPEVLHPLLALGFPILLVLALFFVIRLYFVDLLFLNLLSQNLFILILLLTSINRILTKQHIKPPNSLPGPHKNQLPTPQQHKSANGTKRDFLQIRKIPQYLCKKPDEQSNRWPMHFNRKAFRPLPILFRKIVKGKGTPPI
jgi:hypothetical protein